MSIHPSALVETGARVADSAVIGPFCVVSAGAVIGEECVLQSHVVIEGAVEMGPRNRIGHGTVIGGDPQDLSFDRKTISGVVLGAENTLREHCTIHRGAIAGSVTRIGDRNFLMAGAHLGHNAQVGHGVIIANSCLLGGHVQIGDNAFIGGGCTFHQHVHVGRLAMLQGNSGFSKDVPPYVMATGLNQIYGLNVIGLRRSGLDAAARDEIKRAFKLFYESGHNVRQALAAAAEQEWSPFAREFFDFIAHSKRGVSPLRRSKRGDLGDAESE